MKRTIFFLFGLSILSVHSQENVKNIISFSVPLTEELEAASTEAIKKIADPDVVRKLSYAGQSFSLEVFSYRRFGLKQIEDMLIDVESTAKIDLKKVQFTGCVHFTVKSSSMCLTSPSSGSC